MAYRAVTGCTRGTTRGDVEKLHRSLAAHAPAAPLPLALGTLPVHVGNRGDASFTPSIAPPPAGASFVVCRVVTGCARGTGTTGGDVEELRRSLAAHAPAAPLPLALGTLPVHVDNRGDASFTPSIVSRRPALPSWRAPVANGSPVGRGSFLGTHPLRPKRAPKTR